MKKDSNLRESTLYPERHFNFDGKGYLSPRRSRSGYFSVTINPGNDKPMADIYDFQGVADGDNQKVYSTNSGFYPKQVQIEIMARCVAVLRTNAAEMLKLLNEHKVPSLLVTYLDSSGRERQFSVYHMDSKPSPSLMCDMRGGGVIREDAHEVNFEQFMSQYIEGMKDAG